MFLGTSRLFRYAVTAEGSRGAAIVEGRQVVLRACLTCNGPAVVSEGLTGGGLVLGKMPQSVRTTIGGLAIDGIDMHRAQIGGDSDPAKVAPALVAEFLFRARNEPPKIAAGKGRQPIVLVDVAGYRVYDRCTGRMYAAWPGGDGGTIAAVEKTDHTCPGYVKPVMKVEENLPAKLDDEGIKRVLEGAREDVLVCYDKYREGGYAPAKITVTGANGRIEKIAIGGKFDGTPTAQCIEKVMRAVTFPRFKEKDLQIDWQFFLQD